MRTECYRALRKIGHSQTAGRLISAAGIHLPRVGQLRGVVRDVRREEFAGRGKVTVAQDATLTTRTVPGAVCHIAGNHGGLDLNLLNDPNGGVLFHGLVPDIRPYLAMSQAMVVPLQVGSGTRIKIIESMATGTPVVSTRIGTEGIRCTHNKDILLADTTEELAKSVVTLLRDRQAAYRIGQAGRCLVEMHYNWDNSAEIMRETIQTAIP